MFCRRCYADLHQAMGSHCLRCNRPFDRERPSSYLHRPFPSKLKMAVHLAITFALTSLVSVVVAALLAAAQVKFVHSGH